MRHYLIRSTPRLVTAPYGFRKQPVPERRRSLLTLAIESSCDDTSVALLERRNAEQTPEPDSPLARLLFHETITASNKKTRGIDPIEALRSHQKALAQLTNRCLQSLPDVNRQDGKSNTTKKIFAVDGGARGTTEKTKPDFVTVTRGPGMRANLSTGLDFAKGLAVAWQVPLMGVNHMQAHALTPRLVSALENGNNQTASPDFPFLSLLVSGGHTMLVLSKALTNHEILATTLDVGIGETIDKTARSILPQDTLAAGEGISNGPLLEKFVFPAGVRDGDYEAPRTRQEEIRTRLSSWGWGYGPPLAQSKTMAFSFSGLEGTTSNALEKANSNILIEERLDMGKEVMRVAFEHLATRVVYALENLKASRTGSEREITTLVVSGGVAANKFLRFILKEFLAVRGFPNIHIIFPPISLCTDNAAMIAWTGMEMYEAGWETELSCEPIRRWSLDPSADDGGILGVSSWKRRPQFEECLGH